MPKNMLVADDSVVIQKSIGITFAQEDYAITYVNNGQDAIAKAKQVKPDIMLVDTTMPIKSGYDVCDAIRKDPQLARVPILLLAGTHEPFDVPRSQSVGATGYIIKPFESQALIDRVRDVLAGKPAAPAPAPARPAPPTPSPASTIAGVPTATPPRPAPITRSPASTIAAATPSRRDTPMLDLETPEPVAAAPAFDASFDLSFDQPAEAAPPPAADPASPPLTEAAPGGDFWDFGADTAPTATPSILEETPAPGLALDDTAPMAFAEPAPEPVATDAFPAAGDFGFDLSGGETESAPVTDGAASQEFEFAVAEPPPPSNGGATVELNPAQVEEIVTRVFKSVIERIAWEVVPDLAETIIKEELARLTKDRS